MFVFLESNEFNLWSSVEQLHNVMLYTNAGVCSHTHSMEFMSTEFAWLLHAAVVAGVDAMYSGIFCCMHVNTVHDANICTRYMFMNMQAKHLTCRYIPSDPTKIPIIMT